MIDPTITDKQTIGYIGIRYTLTFHTQVLSHHQRLGSPMPPRDASQLAKFMSESFHPSSLELHESILAALADLYIHGTALPPNFIPDDDVATGREFLEQSGKTHTVEKPDSSSSSSSWEHCRAAVIWRRVWELHGALPLEKVPATLERVRCLETLGTVRRLANIPKQARF